MTMNEAGDLTGCEKLTALRVALNRPASLRKAIARSPIDASRLGASASREASRIAVRKLHRRRRTRGDRPIAVAGRS